MKAYLGFYDYLAIANASISKHQREDHVVKSYLKQGLYSAYYFLNKKSRLAQNDLVAANPDLPRILQLWNLLENKYLQQT